MSSKTHKQAKRFSSAELFQRVQRSLKKRDFKQAYKDAKVCYQDEPTEPHRQLLERAWLSRAMALHRAGLAAESRDSARGLLDFGVTDPELRKELPELLTAVGLLDRALGGQGGVAVEVSPELLASAADRAVASPATAPKSLPEIAPGAARVRAALEAIYRGDEAAALEQLKEVPRTSPFADWRWFVRGLAAYYRGEGSEVQANWDRLDQGRLGARIAVSLRAMAGQGAGGADGGLPAAAGVLERTVLGASVTTYLRDVLGRLAEDDLRGAVKVLRRCRPTIERVAPDILGRIERLLCATFVRKGDASALENLCSAASAPPMDPHWNRAWAILWEHPECDDVDQAERFWFKYLEDLAALPDLESSERALAQALVWQWIGKLNVECVGADEEDIDEEDEDEDSKEDKARAIACFREAIRLAPQLLGAYESLAEAYREWGQEEEAAKTRRHLLEQFPDHLDSLTMLFQHHLQRREMIAARDYALRAWRLKPANPEIVRMVWMGHVGAARQLALEGKFDLGRAELAAAERLGGDHGEPYHLVARKAILEYKAGDAALGQRLADEALGMIEDPAPALLVLLIEAIRYELPYRLDGVKADLERRWQQSLKRKRLGKTAGRLCRTMLGHLVGGWDYPGRSVHVEQVLDYVKRCGRIRWEADDYRDVCLFLKLVSEAGQSPGVDDLLNKLVRRGVGKFPETPDFPFLAGGLELSKGARDCNRTLARRYFERARDLARNGGPKCAFMVEEAERNLTFLAEVGAFPWRGFSAMPGGRGRAGRFDDDSSEEGDSSDGIRPGDIFAMFARTCESLGLDPEEVMKDIAAGGGPFRFPRPGGRGASGEKPDNDRKRKAKGKH